MFKLPRRADVPAFQRGDVAALRALLASLEYAMDIPMPSACDVRVTSFEARVGDGTALSLKWYSRASAVNGPAVVYLHGGGMIHGSADTYDQLVSAYVESAGVPLLFVEYRLAPEHPHPTPLDDCYAAFVWLVDHAEMLGVDPSRVAVMGDSAGGGLAAGVALVARDRGLPLARQILIYPMLDDRNTIADESLSRFAVWTYDHNFTGWSALLGDRIGRSDVPHAAAPARAVSLAGVAPAYIEVGELDIFRDEDIVYAARVASAGVPVELHVHPGAPHAFDRLAPEADVTRRAVADRIRVLSSL